MFAEALNIVIIVSYMVDIWFSGGDLTVSAVNLTPDRGWWMGGRYYAHPPGGIVFRDRQNGQF